MIALHSVRQVVAAEQAHDVELAAGVLMERAATAVAVSVVRLLREERGTTLGARVVVVAGSGNNGGDALFAGAQLAARGVRVDAIGDGVHPAAMAALARAGGRLARWDDPGAGALIAQADVIVDGIVGIGATRPLRGMGAALAPLINAAGAAVVAVDLPSGIDADSGAVPGDAIAADLTVTFGAVKAGLVLAPAAQFVGVLHPVDIGITDALGEPVAGVLERGDVAAYVPAPGFADHKYRRGVVGISAGSAQYRGAALLCTGGALGGDIGMVRYLDRGDGVAPMVLACHPQVVLTATADGPRCDAWVVGSGFPGDDADALVIEAAVRSAVPVVLDAGALALLATRPDLRQAVRDRAATTVVTPHEGEFARMGGRLDGRGRLDAARALAAELGAVVLLKGPASVVASPAGRAYVDAAGTPALATAGSGDVLAGLTGALLAGRHARRLPVDPDAAARAVAAACWLHGNAGERAARGGGSVTAVEILREVPAAVGVARGHG